MASSPKLISTVPESRLIHAMALAFRRELNRLVISERKVHQAMDPENTPAIRHRAAMWSVPIRPSLIPANMAIKERMVIGFVRVRKSAEKLPLVTMAVELT
jgi:hypothetical protein